MTKNTKRLSVLMLGLAGFLLLNVGQANAIQIELPGRMIDTESSGGNSGAQIQYEGGATLEATKTTTQSGTTVNVNRTTPTSVQSNTSVKVNVNGKSVQVSSDKDLETYKSEVASNCSVVRQINTDGTEVKVSYNQPARLFGIFRSNLNAEVQVSESGEVNISLPWYSFLFTKNSSEVKTAIESNISVNYTDSSIGVQRKAIAIDLVNSALSVEVAPCSEARENSAEVKTTTKTETSKPTTSAPKTNTAPKETSASASASASVNVTVPDFKGEWNGTYSPNALVSDDCKPGGEASLSIDSNGAVFGYIIFRDEKGFGTGKVDASGNLSGSWNYKGVAMSFSGKINGNTGSGSYQNNLGCFGTFSISR